VNYTWTMSSSTVLTLGGGMLRTRESYTNAALGVTNDALSAGIQGFPTAGREKWIGPPNINFASGYQGISFAGWGVPGALYGGGVSVEDGVVYATNGIGDVGALKVADGSLIWKKRPGGPLRGAPSIGNGNIYVTSQDNQLFALKAADGNIEWSSSASLEVAGVFGAASPAIGQGTVVQGFSSGELNAYRYENGRSLWGDALSRTSMSTSVAALSDIDADPVIDRGRVFAIGAGGRMVSVDLVTGQRIWEINIAGLATPWVAGEWVFAVTDDAKLHCIARATGKIRWTLLLPHFVKNKADKAVIRWYGPVLAGGRLILTSTEGQIANVNPGDGSLNAMGRGSGPTSFGPIVANNMLYTLDNAGHLTAWR